MPEIVFSTVHGSHLYGLAGPNSDVDTFVVTTSNRGAHQRKYGVEDDTSIGFDAFMEYAYNGSHQSVEALFSPYKVWGDGMYEKYGAMIEGMYVGGPEVLAKYRRTIKKFAHADDFKRRRHACRLWLNMQDLRRYGRFNPVMDHLDAAWATGLAVSPNTGEELYALLCEGDSALADERTLT